MDKRTLLAIVLTFGVLLLWEALYMAPRRAEFARKQAAALAEKRRADSLATAGASTEQPAGLIETDETPKEERRKGTEAFFGGDTVGLAEKVRIVVSTGVCRVTLSSEGAEVTSVVLEKYARKDGTPIELVPPESKRGLSLAFLDQGEWKKLDRSFEVFVEGIEISRDSEIILGQEREEVEIEFRRAGRSGEVVQKKYVFRQGSYAADILISIERSGELARTSAYRMGWECGLEPSEVDVRADRNKFAALGFVGEEYRKVDLSKFGKDREISYEGTVLWGGARTKYFMSALIAQGGRGSGKLLFFGDRASNHIGFAISSPFRGDPRKVDESYTWYAGPLDMKLLRSFGVGMEKAIDLGRMRFLSAAILRFMVWMYRWVPNYGLVIVILSVMTKLLFYRLTHKSFKSMKDMQRLQPKIKELQEKFKNDRDRMNKEIMKAYKEAGVNPLGGCLPLLLQMPVFIALYNALSNTIELRGAPFALWIRDLSMPDTLFRWSSAVPLIGKEFHLLPVLMGAAMVWQSRMGGSPTGEGAPAAQTKMMNYMMPVIFTIFFYSMPAGLVLYWLVNQVFSIGQQYLAQREIEREESERAARAAVELESGRISSSRGNTSPDIDGHSAGGRGAGKRKGSR